MKSDICVLRAPKGAVRKKKRLGRGQGSGSGTTAGRGNKGQKARAAGLPGPYLGFEGGQVPLYRRVATRGFSNARYSIKYTSVNFSGLERVYNDGEKVSWDTLVEKGLIKRGERLIKILAGGKLTKKLSVSTSFKMSSMAKQGIESVGGQFFD